MYRKLTKLLALALTILFLVSTLAIAGQMATGTIKGTDAEKGMIELITADGQTHQLQASAELQAGLKAGDVVAVEVEGTTIKAIKKQ